ncbi:hypothetical protein T265_06401 [Opisthorchis viverrini]|uniref:Uncharacterized protein n=1 Tax=Opisthorchis viverrini TaxID=6198 RepID=A0A074ZGD8_OPIVI|nr:hypothetical protein T265_06401 [Opisthorchis viverrini]KER26356.1 hypothetical protein T265_06401 [Opisthorchis viverrini]
MGHRIDLENVEVLRRGLRFTPHRLTAEAVEITRHYSVNRMEGAELPTVWKAVLRISGSRVKEAVETELVEIDDALHNPVATFYVYYEADPGTKLQHHPKEFNLHAETTIEVRFRFPVPPNMTVDASKSSQAKALSDMMTKELNRNFDMNQVVESTVLEGFEFTGSPVMFRGMVNFNLYKLQKRFIQFDWTNPVNTFNLYMRNQIPFFMKGSVTTASVGKKDTSAQVGRLNPEEAQLGGRFGVDTQRSDSGKRLLQCLFLVSTNLQHERSNRVTYRPPATRRFWTQLDHVTINYRWNRQLKIVVPSGMLKSTLITPDYHSALRQH